VKAVWSGWYIDAYHCSWSCAALLRHGPEQCDAEAVDLKERTLVLNHILSQFPVCLAAKREPIRRSALGAAGLSIILLTSGCANLSATLGKSSDDVAAADEAVQEKPAPKLEEPELVLPEVPLTADLLYDLLVAEIGPQRDAGDESLQALVRAAQSTEDPRLFARATREAIRQGNYALGLTAAERWSQLQPESRAPREALTVVYLAQANLEKAEEVTRALLADSQDIGQSYRRLADLMLRQEKKDGYLELLQKLVDLNPENPDAWYSLAFFADRVDSDDLANSAIEKALTLKPDWEEAALAKAGYLIQADRDDEYAAYSNAFLKRNPKATRYRLHYARALVDQSRTEEALEEFKRVVEHDPENADAVYAVGILSIQAEEYKQARTFLERILELRPDNDQARLYLGQVHVETKEYDEAKRWYDSIDSDAYRFEAQRLIGVMLAESESVDNAIAWLKSLAPANDEDRAQLFLTQEQLLRSEDRLVEAKTVLDEGLTVFPDNGDLLYARALVSAQLDELDLHERDLRKLIKNEPDNAHAYNALGYTLADQTDRYEEALALVTKALELRPDDAFIIDSMGWVQYRLGNLEKARDLLQKALDTRPDAEIAAHLGEVLWKLGETDAARAIWKDAMSESPDNKVLKETVEKLTGS